MPVDPAAAAESIFREGVQSVHPGKLIRSAVRLAGDQLLICGNSYHLSSLDKIYVTGAGKAAAGMALTLEELLGEYISEGIIAVKYGHDLPLEKIRQIPAAHPLPDEQGRRAARAVADLLKNTTEKDLVICLLSGGASALLADYAPGISLSDLRELSATLLGSGAAITEINTVRKHLSTLKGGQLARCAHPASLVSLIISDVVGDDPAVIASGPTAPDRGTFNDALQVIRRFCPGGAGLPVPVKQHLERGSRGEVPETPKAGDPVFSKVRNHIIGSNRIALSAAAGEAGKLGYHASILGAEAEGAAEEIASGLVNQALNYRGPLPACLLLGGESTVEVTGGGKGGRNQHLALAAALALEKSELPAKEGIIVFSAGTDGTDGPTDMAGAVAGTALLENARGRGLQPEAFLKACDSYNFFARAGGHVHTGPTQSNVMDLMMVLLPG